MSGRKDPEAASSTRCSQASTQARIASAFVEITSGSTPDIDEIEDVEFYEIEKICKKMWRQSTKRREDLESFVSTFV